MHCCECRIFRRDYICEATGETHDYPNALCNLQCQNITVNFNQTPDERTLELVLAAYLTGREVWAARWFNPNLSINQPYVIWLAKPEVKRVEYASINPNGQIYLHFKKGVMLISEFNKSFFTFRDSAQAAIDAHKQQNK